MNGPSTDAPGATAPSAPETAKKKRGRETTGDMVRSLGLVMLIVVAVWFLAQPPDSDEKRGVRVIDPSTQTQSWTTAVPGAPVVGDLPAGWRPTVAYYDPAPDRLRLGHVTPEGQYAEFAASTQAADEFVPELTGTTSSTETVDVEGEQWSLHVQDDGSRSLVRTYDEVTVVVGTLRATASLDELTTLAASVSAAR